MNIKKRLLHLANLSAKDRQTGRTTLTARAAKEVGGIVLARTHDEAKFIERTHNVTARSMEINLDGYSGPFFIDHHAVESLLVSAATKIENLEWFEKQVPSLLAEITEKDKRIAELELMIAQAVGALRG